MAQRKAEAKEKFWLYAFRDHLANLQVYSNCIQAVDITGDGDYKLLIADGSKKLKTYAGTALLQEVRLLGVPSAVTSFNMVVRDSFHWPTVAVAVGPFIFMYRNSKPLYRFTTPPIKLDPEEVETWALLGKGQLTIEAATTVFEKKLDQGVDVSTRTLELLLMDTDIEKEAFVLRFIDRPLVQNDVVVCMASVNESRPEESQPSCLLYGTEKRMLYVLGPDAAEVVVRVELPSTPVSILTAGVLDGNYRIAVCCRDGRIYFIKDGKLQTAVIQPDAQPCGMSRYDNLIAVITMANTLTYYTLKGKRQDAVFLPVPATNISTISDTVTGAARGVIVALSNGEVRVYVGKHLQHVSQAYGTVTAMSYCRYGREDSALILVLQNGSLVVELLHRNANLSVSPAAQKSTALEVNALIPVPKLSSVFTIQTEREKEYGIDMYRNFQYDLCHLKLHTSKAYLAMMSGHALPAYSPATDSGGGVAGGAQSPGATLDAAPQLLSAPGGGGTTSLQQRRTSLFGESSAVRFVATVQGLGPLFKIKGILQNVGDAPLHDILVAFLYDNEVYEMPRSLVSVPYLVPGLSYPCDALVALREGETKGDGVLAMVLGYASSGRPLASTLVDLPEADLIESA